MILFCYLVQVQVSYKAPDLNLGVSRLDCLQREVTTVTVLQLVVSNKCDRKESID